MRTSVRLKVSAEGSTRIFASFLCLEGRSKNQVDKVLVSESAAGCMCRGCSAANNENKEVVISISRI